MEIRQINCLKDSSNNNFHQNYFNLYDNAGDCIFKLMISNDKDVGSYFCFYNKDGTLKFRFTLKDNKISSYSEYRYKKIGKCKKKVSFITNIEKSFKKVDITYLDEFNQEIIPEVKSQDLKYLTNKKFLQLQLDIVNKKNKTNIAK